MEDDLAQRAMLELRRRQYGDPFGRHSQGTLAEHVEALQIDDVRAAFPNPLSPNEAILSAAGKDRLSPTA